MTITTNKKTKEKKILIHKTREDNSSYHERKDPDVKKGSGRKKTKTKNKNYKH